MIYYEDFKVGQMFVSGIHALTEAEIIEYAKQYDPQPFHVDPVAAASSFFGGLAASGWHTASLTMRLLVTSSLGTMVGGMVGAGCEVHWVSPTRAGDRLQVISEITDMRPSKSRPKQGLIWVYSKTINQDQTVRMTQTARLVVERKPQN